MIVRRPLFTAVFGLAIVAASGGAFAECRVGYQPQIKAYRCSVEDLGRMELTENSRLEMEAIVNSFHYDEEALLEKYEDDSRELSALLTHPFPNREKADDLLASLGQTLTDLNRLRVDHAINMSERLRRSQLRAVRTPAGSSSSCYDGMLPIGYARFTLDSGSRKKIAVSEDEEKYLKDFDRREKYFRTEARRLMTDLDSALRTEGGREDALVLVERLNTALRSQAIVRLDRYFFSDQVLFTAGRADRLIVQPRPVKLKKQKAPVVKTTPIRQEVAAVKSDGRRWYWPFKKTQKSPVVKVKPVREVRVPKSDGRKWYWPFKKTQKAPVVKTKPAREVRPSKAGGQKWYWPFKKTAKPVRTDAVVARPKSKKWYWPF